MKWKTLKTQTVYENPFFKISADTCEKQNGDIVEHYYRVERPNVAVIGALTGDNNIILINQYRQPVRAIDIELPAGYIDDNETGIIQAAKRELREETGYEASQFIHLYETYASAGLMSTKIHFFLALNSKKVGEPILDENEEITVRPTKWEEALALLKEEKIKDMASVTGLLLIKDYLKK